MLEDRLNDVIKVQSEIASTGLNLLEVMEVVTRRAQELVGATGAVVELVEDDEMVYRAVSGLAAGSLGLRLQRAGSLSGLCVENSELLICADSETDTRVDVEACRRLGLRSMIVVPLPYGGQTIGVLKVMAPDTDAFHPVDGSILQLMAGLIGASVVHARVHESVNAKAEEFAYLATHDHMTDLPNRALAFDRMRFLQARRRRLGGEYGLVMVDIDGFKRINDTYGHDVGDSVIKGAARRLTAAVREVDLPARLGGDEFVVVVHPPVDPDSLETVKERVNAALSERAVFDGHTIDMSASVGGVVTHDELLEPDAVLRAADLAMYDTKRARRQEAG